MTRAIRSIALGLAALIGAASATTVAMPTASAHDRDRHEWRGEHHGRYNRGYYRGGGPVYVAPAPYYRGHYRHRHYRGGYGGGPVYGPGYYQPGYVAPRPGVTFHIGH